MENQMEQQLSLEDLIVCTREAIAPLNHSKSTLWQYNYALEELRFYFIAHGYDSFLIDLAGRYVDEAMQKYKQGAPKMWKFKLFRHTRAMHLYQAGIPLSYIKDFLGHASVNTTDIYASADLKMMKQALLKNVCKRKCPLLMAIERSHCGKTTK
jgi:hypothetical protein